MPVYNFKKMSPVPTAPELIDIVLMRTQRRTPTVIHPGYKITRIRAFYMRKIKFTQQTISERLTQILTDFPRLNDIHPFYSDLCNTLYDRDHYKLALGQINTARSLVDQVARDMIRMVKYGDSLYRCKCLKRAALGRMCTILKRQKAALAYLDEVRKHMSRLPALDPNARTLLMCGLPNVGKSSFMNKITRANVDVQPYAFTTKSLFVGHCDYRYLRWQVIDTPGILDHPLEERNTIEMQAITALAHLTCSVLYFLDISEQCGYTIEQQCNLFKSIQPLFANKQLIIVVNKVDQQPWETLENDKRRMIEGLARMGAAGADGDGKTVVMTMSNLSEHGVSDVKNAACDKLLAARVDARVSGNKVDAVMNRLRVFYPTPRDNVERDVCIPDAVLRDQEAGTYGVPKNPDQTQKHRGKVGYAPTTEDVPRDHHDHDDVDMHDDDDDAIAKNSARTKKTARDLMWENGGPGVWAPDYRDIYDLKDPDWRFDAIPEIMNGKNIADFVDPDIDTKLRALEREEEQIAKELEAAGGAMGEDDEESDLDSEEEATIHAIRDRKKIERMASHTNKTVNKPMMPRSIRGRARDVHHPGTLDAAKIKERMDSYGVDASLMLERGRSLERQNRGRKRERSLSRRAGLDRDDKDDDGDKNENADADMDDVSGMSKGAVKRAKRAKTEERKREESLARSHSRPPREPSQVGLKDEATAQMARRLERRGRRQWRGGSGEGDHRKSVHLVKWMNTGKKRLGTHYCR